MPIIGGTAHWIGPVIGALLLGTMQQIVTVTISSELNVLVVGVLLVVFVVARAPGHRRPGAETGAEARAMSDEPLLRVAG